MRYWLIMPAAGAGRRFGAAKPKQYAALKGRTVMEWALSPFLADARCMGAVVVLANGDPYWSEVADRLRGSTGRGRMKADPLAGSQFGSTGHSGSAEHPGSAESSADVPVGAGPTIILAPGGEERGSSVRNGLMALEGRAAADDWILVHDAARPCLPAQDLASLLERLGSHPVGGLLASPAADTLKRAGAEREVEQTVDRSSLWRALTPQMFRYARLREALDKALAERRFPTDEAQAVEWLGDRPMLVEGSAANIKVTSADDLLVAEALLRPRRS